jgi:hypothetical protein
MLNPWRVIGLMSDLNYKTFYISVSTERVTGKWACLTPLVEIRCLKSDPKPFFIVMTTQFFRSEQESEVCGINLGKDWIDQHPLGV